MPREFLGVQCARFGALGWAARFVSMTWTASCVTPLLKTLWQLPIASRVMAACLRASDQYVLRARRPKVDNPQAGPGLSWSSCGWAAGSPGPSALGQELPSSSQTSAW